MKKIDFEITKELTDRSVEIAEKLYEMYRQDSAGRILPAIDELIFTILSQNTTDKNCWVAFNNLKDKYPEWEMLATAADEDIAAAISYAGLSKQKAPRIKKIIEILLRDFGRADLDFLKDWEVQKALDWLINLPGVGRKTASCVLLFNFNMPCLPVDTHVLRISKILGLIPPDVNADEACELLERIVPEKEYLRFHTNIILHGRNLCTAKKQYCEKCPISYLCLNFKLLGKGNLTFHE